MKKLCIITTVPGTLRSFVVPTAEYLYKECGYDITLICTNDDEFAASLPEYIRYIPVKMSRGIDFTAPGSIWNFIKIFKREKFDLVQYATPNASFYASIAARICRVPIRLYCQWGIRYVGLSGKSRKIFKLFEAIVCKNSTHIRSVSPKNLEFAISEGLYSSSKAKVIGNGGTIGVDLNAFDIENKAFYRKEIRDKYNLSDNETVFGFVGRFSRDKGCGELLRAFKKISEEREDVRLMLVGRREDPAGISEELVRWAEESPKVIFSGRITKEEIKKYYSAIDILTHPSYREGFGMVLQEAGALGVPMITTRITGASEVMEEGKSCLLAEPRNAEDLEEKMLTLLMGKELAENLGNAAYERTKTFYARPVMLQNQKMDYMELLGEE